MKRPSPKQTIVQVTIDLEQVIETAIKSCGVSLSATEFASALRSVYLRYQQQADAEALKHQGKD